MSFYNSTIQAKSTPSIMYHKQNWKCISTVSMYAIYQHVVKDFLESSGNLCNLKGVQTNKYEKMIIDDL